MIAIKKLTIALLALSILAIIVIAIAIYGDGSKTSKAPTSMDLATSVASSDPDVQRELAYDNVKLLTESKPFVSGPIKGFLNVSSNLTAVHVMLRSPSVPPPDYNFYYIVDIDSGLIIDRTSFFDVMAGDDEMSLLPGSAWYYRISNNAMSVTDENYRPVNATSARFGANYTPGDAIVYQAIVNERGLDKLRNASGGIHLQDADIADDTIVFNGTLPRGTGWNGSVTFPSVEDRASHGTYKSYMPDGDYYLVFINGEKDRLVNLTFRSQPQGAVWY